MKSLLPLRPVALLASVLAAGAMLFVIINHALPETRAKGLASCVAVAGFVALMVLDTT